MRKRTKGLKKLSTKAVAVVMSLAMAFMIPGPAFATGIASDSTPEADEQVEAPATPDQQDSQTDEDQSSDEEQSDETPATTEDESSINPSEPLSTAPNTPTLGTMAVPASYSITAATVTVTNATNLDVDPTKIKIEYELTAVTGEITNNDSTKTSLLDNDCVINISPENTNGAFGDFNACDKDGNQTWTVTQEGNKTILSIDIARAAKEHYPEFNGVENVKCTVSPSETTLSGTPFEPTLSSLSSPVKYTGSLTQPTVTAVVNNNPFIYGYNAYYINKGIDGRGLMTVTLTITDPISPVAKLEDINIKNLPSDLVAEYTTDGKIILKPTDAFTGDSIDISQITVKRNAVEDSTDPANSIDGSADISINDKYSGSIINALNWASVQFSNQVTVEGGKYVDVDTNTAWYLRIPTGYTANSKADDGITYPGASSPNYAKFDITLTGFDGITDLASFCNNNVAVSGGSNVVIDTDKTSLASSTVTMYFKAGDVDTITFDEAKITFAGENGASKTINADDGIPAIYSDGGEYNGKNVKTIKYSSAAPKNSVLLKQGSLKMSNDGITYLNDSAFAEFLTISYSDSEELPLKVTQTGSGSIDGAGVSIDSENNIVSVTSDTDRVENQGVVVIPKDAVGIKAENKLGVTLEEDVLDLFQLHAGEGGNKDTNRTKVYYSDKVLSITNSLMAAVEGRSALYDGKLYIRGAKFSVPFHIQGAHLAALQAYYGNPGPLVTTIADADDQNIDNTYFNEYSISPSSTDNYEVGTKNSTDIAVEGEYDIDYIVGGVDSVKKQFWDSEKGEYYSVEMTVDNTQPTQFVYDTTSPSVDCTTGFKDVLKNQAYQYDKTGDIYFTNSALSFSISVTEKNLFSESGLMHEDNATGKVFTITSPDGAVKTLSFKDAASYSKTGDTYTFSFALDSEQEGLYTIEIGGKVYDLAGNSTSLVDVEIPNNKVQVMFDKTAPEVTISKGDEVKSYTDGDSNWYLRNHKDADITITVKDTNLSYLLEAKDPEVFILDNNKYAVSTFDVSGDTATIVLTAKGNTADSDKSVPTAIADGFYTIQFNQIEDLAGNKADMPSDQAVCFDTILPVLYSASYYPGETVTIEGAELPLAEPQNEYNNIMYYQEGAETPFAYVQFKDEMSKILMVDADVSCSKTVTKDAQVEIGSIVFAFSDENQSVDSNTGVKNIKALDRAGNISNTYLLKSANEELSTAWSDITNVVNDNTPVGMAVTVAGETDLSNVKPFYNSDQSAYITLSDTNLAALLTAIQNDSKFETNYNTTILTFKCIDNYGIDHPGSLDLKSFKDLKPQSSMTQSFNMDADYEITFVPGGITDLSNNENGQESETVKFTVDMIDPVIKVAFDNNDVRNGKYYKAGRTATITVEEHNFDPSLFTIATNGAVSGWTTSGDTHTATVSFSSDGVYNLTVSGKDEAGNEATPWVEPEFIVDLTAPTITFSNVEESHAYNGTIAPTVNMDDTNFDQAGYTVVLSGSARGTKDGGYSSSATSTGAQVNYSDFPYQRDYDDIYTLDVHVTDLAGNEFDSKIGFSVNRFGSNYEVISPTPADVNGNLGYLDAPPTIVVREVNVTGISESSVDVTYNLQSSTLERQEASDSSKSGYTVSSGGTTGGWQEYTYTISPASFDSPSSQKDGNYSVTFTSQDTAGNTNVSTSYYDGAGQASSLDLRFVLDTMNPIINNLSVKDGEVVNSSGPAKVTFDESDNIAVDYGTTEVTVAGQPVNVEVNESTGQVSFEVPEIPFTLQPVSLTVKDYAGNTATVNLNGVKVTSNPIDLYGLPIAIGVIIIIAIIAGIIFMKRRKQGGAQ